MRLVLDPFHSRHFSEKLDCWFAFSYNLLPYLEFSDTHFLLLHKVVQLYDLRLDSSFYAQKKLFTKSFLPLVLIAIDLFFSFYQPRKWKTKVLADLHFNYDSRCCRCGGSLNEVVYKNDGNKEQQERIATSIK